MNLIHIHENGLHLVFEKAENGTCKLLHFSALPFDESRLLHINGKPDTTRYNLLEIMISGQDANDDAVAALKEGKITVTSFGNPYMQGYAAVEAAADILEGKEVGEFVEVATKVVDLSNADTFKNN